jgi:hypothetical protein
MEGHMSEPAHLVTDASGQIHTVSRGARALLAFRGIERGCSLLACFPEYQKALLFDMDIARAGWSTERTLTWPDSAVAVRYRVNRLLPGGGLYWEFRAAETVQQRCA